MQKAMETTNPTATIKCWVELYSDDLFSWALHKTSSKETAEDLVQETFLAAVQSFAKFKGDSNPKTWLFAILNHKINDHYRTSFRKPTASDSTFFDTIFDANEQWKHDQKPQPWADDTGNLLDNTEFRQTLRECMNKLPGNHLSAIHLKFLKKKNSARICQELGITNTNFWQILHRAKLQLRKCLELNWFKK